MTEHLLRPSLAGTKETPALYSPRSSFILGFFMGPVPLILYSAINSVRLRRKADFLVYAAALAVFALLVHAAYLTPRPAAITWLNDLLREGASMRGTMRILAIVLWIVFYFMHRKEQRAADLLGTRPSPWIAAILCAIIGSGIAVLVAMLFKVLQ